MITPKKIHSTFISTNSTLFFYTSSGFVSIDLIHSCIAKFKPDNAFFGLRKFRQIKFLKRLKLFHESKKNEFQVMIFYLLLCK